MNAKQLYKIIDDTFIKEGLSDRWYKYMPELEPYISENFKVKDMGIMCDFSDEINSVITAVFPSDHVLNEIIKHDITNSLLFVHHAANWDSRRPKPFYNMNPLLLDEFRKRRISIYCLHAALDNYSPYSTSNSLAEALGLIHLESFGQGVTDQCGIFGMTDIGDIYLLNEKIAQTVNHKTSIYEYGDNVIKDNRIAIVAGGGNEVYLLQMTLDKGVNTFVTGVTKKEMSENGHDFAKENKISIIGATHYSTEKFACIKMTEFFKEIGLPSQFIEDTPVFEDM